MKLSTLFWGILFVLVGGLFLLDNLGVMSVYWGTVWRLWPLILVFWGITLLVGKQRPPWYAVLLMIVLIIVMVIAVAATDWSHGDYDFASGDSIQQSFEEPMTATLQHATFHLRSGAGRFFINDTTQQLVKATTEVGFGKYELTREHSGDEEYLTLDFRGRNRGWNFGHTRNRADIQLNANPVWNIRLDVGAASGDFDLRPYKVDEVTIDAGASSLRVRLGERSSETRVRVKTGASSTTIDVPESVGCDVKLETALSGKRMRDFEKISNNRYQTSNFDSSSKKIFIEVSAGVSQITIHRY